MATSVKDTSKGRRAASAGRASDPSTSDSALAGALREALRTPAFRELLRLHLRAPRRGELAELVRVALREEPELWLGLASASPDLLDALVQGLAAAGRELAAMPESLVDGYLAQLVADPDREALRALVVLWAPLLRRALPGALNLGLEATGGLAGALAEGAAMGDDPSRTGALEGLDPAQAARAFNRLVDLAAAMAGDPGQGGDASGLPWAALIRELDSGRARQAVVALSAKGRDGARGLLTAALADPVLVANVVAALPHLANDGVVVLSHAVRRLDLPDEVLASALFNVLRALDLPEVGRLLSGAAQIVDTVHQGGAILGMDEPALQAVLLDLVDGLLDTLDLDAVARAAVALGEDGQVVARVLARRVATDPSLLSCALDTAVTLLDTSVRACLEVAWELEQLPPGTGDVVAARLGALDGHAVGQLCNRALELAEALSAVSREQPAVASFLEELDGERAWRLIWRAGAPGVRAASAEVWRRLWLEPEAMAREINALIARFNRTLDVEQRASGGPLSRLMGALDTGELIRAWRGAARLLGQTLVSAAAPGSPVLGAAFNQAARVFSQVKRDRWSR